MADKKTMKKGQPSLTAADLPGALRVFWNCAPDNFRIPSILTAIACYCALATRLRAKYVYDQELHALLLQILVLGEPGSGKSFTRPIVRQLMQPLRLRDIEMKRVEQAYNELKKTASKNKQLPDEPITAVRCLQTITKAKLVKRADMFIRKYGEPMAFWFYNEELATMTESNKRAFADLNTMDRLAYDLGSEFGSDTLSDNSYNADVDIIYCSLFCGTDNALKEYINKRCIEGGNVTRKVLTRIDGDHLGEDAPAFRVQTEGERALVNRTVQTLMAETYSDDDLLQETHQVDMAWMDEAVLRWCREQRKLIYRSGSRAHNCFYKRSSVSAWRMAVLCYHLWCMELGIAESEESKQLEEVRRHVTRFYRFMAQYILDGLLKQWGREYERMHGCEDEEDAQKTTVYDQLPQEFSRDQLRELIVKLDLSTPARVFLHRWLRVKMVRQPNPQVDVFVKYL